ncbi:MAG: MFS transporter, partial [Gemmiger sp.]|nr:MFS transporter [Gemmiger sp.]
MKKNGRGVAVLAAGAAVQLLTGIPAAWGIFQQPIMADYSFTRAQASLCFALLVAAYGVGCVLGGFLQDAMGPRVAGLAGAALLGGGFVAAAFLPQGVAWAFYLAFSLPAGLGSAFLCPAVLACAQKWYTGRKGLATGVTGVSMGLSGAFLTLFVKGVGGPFGMRVCMGALGGVMLLVCGGGALVLQNPPAGAAQPPAGATPPDYTPRQMLKTTQYRLCVAGVALAAPPMLLFSPDILQIAAERGMAAQAVAWCVVLGSAASAAGRLGCPAVSDHLGRKRTLCLIYLGLGVGAVLFAFAAAWWVAAAYALLAFFYAGGAAVQPALNTDLFGLPHAGVNYGFMALGMSAGSLV